MADDSVVKNLFAFSYMFAYIAIDGAQNKACLRSHCFYLSIVFILQ